MRREPPMRMPESSPNPLLVGQRVRVQIAHTERYSGGAGTRFNGLTGTVERRNPHSFNGEPLLTDAYLVRFDEPVAHGEAGLWDCFWFPTCDLETLP